MILKLPDNVNRIIHILSEHGYEAYAVGGCVRDLLLGRTPQDWDITTSAKPNQVKELFSHTIDTGIKHGTVTVMLEHVGYEVTTYRIDGEYEDARHPREVTFTSDLYEDLRRRDFTINAMAYNEKDGLVDAFSGKEDLQNGRIRCVGDPMERFSEDALRMLRAVRFAAQLGFSIDAATQEAVKKLAPTLQRISAERIQTEMVKLLTSPHPEELHKVYELGLSKVFLPEFDRMMETKQQNKHHMYSVGEHTIQSMCHCRADKILRLAMLLHDVAKPVCMTTDEHGQNHFKGHPQQGAQMARGILQRLKFDNDTTNLVCRLIEAHDERPQITERNVRRAMNRYGVDLFPLLFEVKKADTLAQSMYRREEKLAYIEEFRRVYEQILATQQCVRMKDLAISGRDLIAMGMKPGKEIGQVLDELLEQVLEHPEYNEYEKLIELAHNIVSPLI